MNAGNVCKDVSSQIICGDVVRILPTLDRKYDVIIVDPPYNIGKDFGNSNDTMEPVEYVKWSKQWLDQCFNLLADKGLIYVYGFPEILARVAVEYPIEKQRFLVWHYTNKTTPSSQFWQRSYESILCLWKGDRPNLEIDLIREPYTDTYLKCEGKARKNTKGRFGDKPTIYQVNAKGALPRDVIKVPALAGGAGRVERHFLCKTCDNSFYNSGVLKDHDGHDILQHPTQKPMELTKKLIQSRISDFGSVLVPFVGTGSECVVAKELGLHYTGIELNPDYVLLAEKWLNTKNIS